MRRRMCVCMLCAVVSTGLVGCSSKQEKALKQAQQQASATGKTQQVVSVDKDGNTTTTIVQPPLQGQTGPTITTITSPPAPGALKLAEKSPTVSVVGDSEQYSQDAAGNGGAPRTAAPAQVSIPAGTPLAVRIDQTISVKGSRAGDGFTGELVEPISAPDGRVLVPKLTRVRGVVDASHKRGHFKGASLLELRLTAMTLNGRELPIETRDLAERKKGKGKRTAAFIGGGSGLGMLVGGLASGGTGLLWGGLAGAGAGTAVAGLTGNRDLVIPAESVVRFRLAQDVVVQGH